MSDAVWQTGAREDETTRIAGSAIPFPELSAVALAVRSRTGWLSLTRGVPSSFLCITAARAGRGIDFKVEDRE